MVTVLSWLSLGFQFSDSSLWAVSEGTGPCHFPFKYKATLHYSCTQESSFSHWCATEPQYSSKNWRKCNQEDFPRCIFPFTYGGRRYTACTTNGSFGDKPWCAVTSRFEEVKQWKYCVLKPYGGNSKGRPCVFPSIYKGRTVQACIEEERAQLWCPTTANFDQDRQWSFCPDQAVLQEFPPKACRFPFIYKGKVYYSCTAKGSKMNLKWCATTHTYETDGAWIYCSP
ncbi:epididymal sperm-binding protein 1-like [Tachyglossus aculeatus]|uniref:epididymal sperm-binding protein 1-like n=1 Tax=Tachyglossus aculeatus TaxID=9261 RepID=UPI0018F5E1DF|nr:epididymal sperm-binding protein 1-like [Tachyglossus aculeatus]